MNNPKFFIVQLSGCFLGGETSKMFEDEKTYQINRRMKDLYREGCRRFRTIRLVRTGDYDKFKIMGWPAA